MSDYTSLVQRLRRKAVICRRQHMDSVLLGEAADAIERLAAANVLLVDTGREAVAAERERCARICDEAAAQSDTTLEKIAYRKDAAAIRKGT